MNYLWVALFGIFLINTISIVEAFSLSSPQISNPGADSFSYLNKQGISAFAFNPDQCKAGQDFLVQILPFSCSPAVVRSDLLEEQNVPVFCQLTATQINPLIKVNGIDFISFSGDYPKEISGIGFHPANAAVKPSRTTLINSPTLQNIGYAVIVLRQQPNESSMPEFVRGNLTANIKYNIENAFGVGGANLYLPAFSDGDWDNKYVQYGFWNGKGYLRAENIGPDSAVVSVYADKNTRLSTFSLQRGQTSGNVYLPGFYCNVGLAVRLDALEIPDTRVKLDINGEIVEVPQNGKFLNNACTVGTIVKQGINKKTQVTCTTDNGFQRFSLGITPKVRVEITQNGVPITKEVNVGDRLYNSRDNSKGIYLAYVGTGKGLASGLLFSETDSGRDQDLFGVLVAMPEIKDRLSNSELDSISSSVKRAGVSKTGYGLADALVNSYKFYSSGIESGFRDYFFGQDFAIIYYGDKSKFYGGQNFEGVSPNTEVSILGFSTPQNDEKIFTSASVTSSTTNQINTASQSFNEDLCYNVDKKRFVLLIKGEENRVGYVCDDLEIEKAITKKLAETNEDTIKIEICSNPENPSEEGLSIEATQDNCKTKESIKIREVPNGKLCYSYEDHIFVELARSVDTNIQGYALDCDTASLIKTINGAKILQNELNVKVCIDEDGLIGASPKADNVDRCYIKDSVVSKINKQKTESAISSGTNQLISELRDNYKKAMSDYRQIIDKFANEREKDSEPTFGEQAFIQAIGLANEFNQKKTANDLCDEMMQKYSKSQNIPEICKTKIEFSNSELASQSVFINGNLKKISISGIYEPSIDEYSAEFFVRDSSGKTNPYILTKNQVVFLGQDQGRIIYSYESGVASEDKTDGNYNTITPRSGIYVSLVYYKFNDETKKWEWSPDKKYWRATSSSDADIKVSEGPYSNDPVTKKQVVTIKYLASSDFSRGETYLKKISSLRQDQSNDYLQLVGLDANYAIINYNLNGYSASNQRIELGTSNAFRSNYLISLSKINLKKQARVSLIPNIQNTGTQANFSFNIGVEKRAIQLSPEKIQQKITNLNASIGKWQGYSDGIGNVAKGFNAACLVTGATLTAKNFLENLDGKSIARQEVMRSSGGWMDVCSKEIVTTKVSLDKCLLDHSADIDKDVEAVNKIIENQNKNPVTDNNLCDVLTKLKPTEGQISNGLEGSNAKNLPISSDLLSAFGKDTSTGKCEKISLSQARDLQRVNAILSSSASETAKNAARYGKHKILSDINENAQGYAKYNSLAEKLNQNSAIKDITVEVYGSEKSIQGIYGGGTVASAYKDISQNTPVQAIVYNNEKYLIGLTKSSGNTYFIGDNGNAIYDETGVKITDSNKISEIKSRFSKGFIKYDSNSYHNPFLKPEVKYFETEPYKGRPALVPFNTKDGWYVSLKQTLPGFGNIRTYDESGRVENFYLCNVGVNGKAEPNSGDDTCRSFSPGTGSLYGEFPGLTQTETNKLVSQAIQAVTDASRQYKSGLTGRIKILNEMISVGSPAVDVPEVQCQDFMSPSDCNILFNACDPVVCPSSRCNLGGTYYVSDVVQSGIVGSTLLCLPNAQENIAVPVCLSGIKAGLDNYVSLQKNYRDCLQENLATGKTIGLCDEIHSIYLCDFFWNQAQPLSQVLIPKAFEFLTGQNQGTRGGGEYLSVQSAWQNSQDSLNYITNYYGADSFKAFKTQATQSIGSVFCKSFASAQYPSKLGFDSLLEPASPPQFTAYFSENSFTTATVPPISQYKVFYHIFAGKNEGAYYSVYLKSPAGTSFYQTNPTYTVATGFAGVGDYASETKDFTAPTGYKELCIKVNAQEECGFQKVTTDFALNYLTDKYLQEQASQTNINSEASCISGTASAYSLINPNLQAGVQNVIDPNLYNYNIVRICSTENPGKATDPASDTPGGRWQKVGTCDGNAGKLNCYLDTKSVKDAIKSVDLENQTLNDITRNNPNILTEVKTEDIESFKKLSDADKILRITNELITRVTFNLQKAQLLYIRGLAYDTLAKMIKSKQVTSQPTIATETQATTSTSTTPLTCGDCGKSVLGSLTCTKKECTDLGTQIGKSCFFTSHNTVIFSEYGTCNEKKDVTPTIVSQTCESCGDGTTNFCDKKECEVDISNTIGKKCVYTYRNPVLFRDEIGTCKEKSVVPEIPITEINFDEDLFSTNQYFEEDLIKLMNNNRLRKLEDRSCVCGPNCATYARLIESSSERNGVNPIILLSIMMQESSCIYTAVSSAGDSFGLMQIQYDSTRRTAFDEICNGKINGINSINDIKGSGNIDKNIECGAKILKAKYNSYRSGQSYSCGNLNVKYSGWAAAIRGYNGYGCANPNYVDNVKRRFDLIKQIQI